MRSIAYNKSDKPLYVDWNKSSVVLNDRSFPLNPNVSTISGDVTLTDVTWSNSLNYTSGTINGSISHPNQIAFIPPLSSIRVTPIHLMNEFLPKQPTDSVIKANLYTYSGPISVKKQIYSTASSPLMFRCFITYSENSTFTDSRYLDHTFWAKESFRSMAKPTSILPDQYYVSKTTGFGTVIGSIGVIILLVASAAVSGS